MIGAGPRARLPEQVAGRSPAAVGAANGPPFDGPMRTCVGCRGRGSRSELVRVVAVLDGAQVRAVVDRTATMPGRGAWLHAEITCVEQAERRRALPRALHVPGLDVSGLDAVLDGQQG